MTGTQHPLPRRRLTPRALAALSAGCLAVLMAGPASASAPVSQSVINASLAGVSCPSATSCMAVGSYLGQITGTSAYQDFTLAETWNGSTWTIVPSPSPRLPGGGAELNGVSCTSTSNCMAVGETLTFHEPGGYEIPRPFAESWNGSTWTEVATPKLTNAGAALNGVSCTSPTDCMAVGSEGPPKNATEFTLAEAWNGTAWRGVSTPLPLTPGGTALSMVSCGSPSACMAVGYYGSGGLGTSLTLAEFWNGRSWQFRATPTPGHSGSLVGVDCPSATSCTAVGSHAVPRGTLVNATLAEHWSGKGFKVQPTPNPRGAGAAGFDGVSCTRPSDCMATGEAVDQTGENQFTLAEAWNGSSWGLLNTPGPGSFGNDLLGVSCASSSACLAVGEFIGDGDEMTLAEAWNGTRWSVTKTPRP